MGLKTRSLAYYILETYAVGALGKLAADYAHYADKHLKSIQVRGILATLTMQTRIGVDTGGTFTDFVVVRGGRIDVFKKFSTPGSPETAILEGLKKA
jgi:hypothetical protein